jgi:hypothetical protein
MKPAFIKYTLLITTSAHMEDIKNAHKFFFGKPNHSEDLGVDWKVNLELILVTLCMNM